MPLKSKIGTFLSRQNRSKRHGWALIEICKSILGHFWPNEYQKSIGTKLGYLTQSGGILKAKIDFLGGPFWVLKGSKKCDIFLQNLIKKSDPAQKMIISTIKNNWYKTGYLEIMDLRPFKFLKGAKKTLPGFDTFFNEITVLEFMLQKIGTLEIWSLFWWPKITSWKHKTRLVNRVRFWCFSTLKKSKKRPRWPALSSKSDDRNQNHRKWPRNFMKISCFFDFQGPSEISRTWLEIRTQNDRILES